MITECHVPRRSFMYSYSFLRTWNIIIVADYMKKNRVGLVTK